jgi:amino acid permease
VGFIWLLFFSRAGLINAIFAFVLVGALTYFGVEVLFRSGDTAKIFDYNMLASLCYGQQGEVAYDLCCVLQYFGCIFSCTPASAV